MDISKLFLLSVLAFLNLKSAFSGDGLVSIKQVKCAMNAKFVHSNFSCFAKAYSRNFSSARVEAYFKQPLHKIYAEAFFHFKYGTIYREAFHAPRYECCALVNATEKDNPIVHLAIQLVKQMDPNLIHNCPYTNVIVKNRTLNTTLLPFVPPSGDYKSTVFYTTREQESIANLSVVFTVKSSNKDTFG